MKCKNFARNELKAHIFLSLLLLLLLFIIEMYNINLCSSSKSYYFQSFSAIFSLRFQFDSHAQIWCDVIPFCIWQIYFNTFASLLSQNQKIAKQNRIWNVKHMQSKNISRRKTEQHQKKQRKRRKERWCRGISGIIFLKW